MGLPATAWAGPQDTALAPEARGLYLQLIGQARADGRTRASLAYLDDFDRQYPGDLDARVLRINSLLDLGEIDKAEAVAATLPSGDDGRLGAVRGHLRVARGRWAEAMPFYQAALRFNSADAMLRNALGYAQLRAHRYADAVETLRGAADLAPAEVVIRNNLALALTLSGQPGQAADVLGAISKPEERARLNQQVTAEAVRIEALAREPARKGG
ncbi:MAG: pilus assembly protein TadD [Sphingobium sp.]|nr:pilus assembly protein TadD [Sphingobium sp.]